MTNGAGRLTTSVERARTAGPERPGRSAQGTALPAPLDPSGIRHLQRTAGNRAVLRLLGVRSGRSIQRAKDLKAAYAGKALDAAATARLADFQAVIDILGNQAVVAKHLTRLGKQIRSKRTSLAAVLAETEVGAFAVARPILIDFADAAAFAAVTGRGQAFEDLVGPLRHGVHTHRIQWYVVRGELGADAALGLYREALDPRWQLGDKMMWDLIVDALDAGDYTQPEVFLKYLMGLEKDGSGKELRALGKAVRKAEEAGEDLREHLGELLPAKLDAKLRRAGDDYTALMAQADGTGDQPARLSLRKQAYKALEDVRHERMTTVVKDKRLTGGRATSVVWTGWIHPERSKYKDTLPPGTTLVPTVVYVGGDPDERAPAPGVAIKLAV